LRLVLRLFLVLLVVLLLAAGAAYIFRREAVAWLVDRELAAAGLSDLDYTIEDVGLRQIDLTRIGRDGGESFAIDRLTVRYEPQRLIDGEVEQVTIEGLRLKLDLTGAGPILPGFVERRVGAGSTPAAGPLELPPLPPITLKDVHVVAETLIGPTELDLSGDILPDGVGGLGAAFDLTARGDLGHLGGTLSVTREPNGVISGSALLEDGALDLPGGSIGGLGGEMDFLLGGGEEPHLRGQLALSGIEVPRQLVDTADLVFALQEGKFSVDGQLRSPDRKADARVRFTADAVLSDPIVEGEAALRLEGGSSLWPLLGITSPYAGRVQLRLSGNGTLLPLDRIDPQSGGIIGWLADGNTRGRLALEVIDLSTAQRITDLDATLTLDWGLMQGLIVAGLPQDATFTAASLDAGWLAALGIPTDTAAALAGGATIELPADAAADPRLHLEPAAEGHLVDLAGTVRLLTPGGMRAAAAGVITADLSPRLKILALAVNGLAIQAQEVPADGHLIGSVKLGGDLNGTPDELTGLLGVQVGLLRTDLGGYPVEDMAIAGNFDTRLTPGNLAMTLTEKGSISFGQITLAGAPLLPAGAESTIETGVLSIAWSPGPFLLTYEATALMGQQRLSFGRDRDAIPLVGNFGHLRLIGTMDENADYWGSAEITGADLELPAYGLTLGQTNATWIFAKPGEIPPPGKVTVGKGAVSTGFGKIGGLTLDATVVEGETNITLSGTGKGPGGIGRMKLTLQDDDVTGRGNVAVDWGPATFAVGGLQPKSILPILKDFNNVSGKAAIALKFTWTNKSASSEMRLKATDLSFEHPNAKVEGLNGEIVFDRLSQLSTPPGQKIRAKLIDIGVPLADLTATLDIEAGRSPIYVLSDLAFTLFGGHVSLPALRLDPNADTVGIRLLIENMDLALMTKELGISDFSMEGRMSGTLPLGYAPKDETITIASGKLDAITPGVIRYGKPGTAELRSGGDENFTLALQALENFQFKKLDITIDKEANGATKLKIVLEGSNPEVLDGYPFLININLSTNLAEVLLALKEGYRLNPDLFKGGWTFD
jgi:hypothetical protein